MNNDKLIFVTNDDGYTSKGFQAALNVASKFGRVIAIAPDKMQSGKSQAITIYDPLYLHKISQTDNITIYSFSGTPVDCVKVAFDHLLKDQKVDLVISGVNHGSNSAVNVLYSGTMGAAIEASFYDVPAVGLSVTDHHHDADFTAAEHYGEMVVRGILDSSHPLPICLNVNIPSIELDKIEGLRVCRQTRGYWREEFFQRKDPHGREYYWLTGEFKNAEPEAEDTDEWALSNGFVAVVPVQIDLTAYKQLDSLRSILK